MTWHHLLFDEPLSLRVASAQGTLDSVHRITPEEARQELPRDKMIITYDASLHEHTSARAVLDLNAKGIENAAPSRQNYVW